MKPLIRIRANGRSIDVINSSGLIWTFTAPAGAAIAIPIDAKVVRIEPENDVVYWRLGDSSITAAATAPGNVTDNSASAYLPTGATEMVGITGETHIALKSAGVVRLSWWS